MIGFGHRLEKIVESSVHLEHVRKEDLQFGDLVIITTRNSCYSVYVLDDEGYLVSGGWFDKKRLSPLKISISGCTWGGSIIKVDTIAACGLRLEFSNRVITTPIKRIEVVRATGKS